MKFRPLSTKRKAIMDLTPLIDVVFLLLIFFMLSSSVITQSGIRINLPTVSKAKIGPINRIEIKIPSDDTIFVNNRQVTLEELNNIIENLDHEKMVMIKGDQGASLGRVVRIWDICKKNNITKLNIATEINTKL